MNMKQIQKEVVAFARQYGVHVAFLGLIVVCAVWVYTGLDKDKPTMQNMEGTMDHSMMNMQQPTSENTQQGGAVTNNDQAVRGYLEGAQTLAEVYYFTNQGSYAGLCEKSDSLYTLEGNSGGILKFIKMVGATEVFCSTGDSAYLIEAKMPGNGLFFCIESTGAAVEQKETREGSSTCRP